MRELLLKKLIKRYQYISFDIFDTLIERDVTCPSDIFKIVGYIVLGEEKAEEFFSQRKRAEENARKKVIHKEVTLSEIYENLDGYSPLEKEQLKKMEIKMEFAHCHAKKEIFKIYQYALSCKKIIYLISDMYLPENVIRHMLKICGITEFHKLYISNYYRKNKQNGELFQIVLKENYLRNGELIHIGDSIKADFFGAYKAGVQPWLIGRKNRFIRFLRK